MATRLSFPIGSRIFGINSMATDKFHANSRRPSRWPLRVAGHNHINHFTGLNSFSFITKSVFKLFRRNSIGLIGWSFGFDFEKLAANEIKGFLWPQLSLCEAHRCELPFWRVTNRDSSIRLIVKKLMDCKWASEISFGTLKFYMVQREPSNLNWRRFYLSI